MTTEQLSLALPRATTYQMQTWSHADACTCGMRWRARSDEHKPQCLYPATTFAWEPMENGAAPAVWQPRSTARAAVKKAATWTGAIGGHGGFPAMQVVEVSTGRVIWRDSARYPAAGEPIAPAWQKEAYAEAIHEYDAYVASRQAELSGQGPERAASPAQQVLF